MTEQELIDKISELILNFKPDCSFVVIIHDDETSGQVTEFGYGCKRCMAPVLEQAAFRGLKEPHNEEGKVH